MLNIILFNSLPNDEILDYKINVSQKFWFVFDRVEHIVGKGENAGYQHFLPFPTMFLKAFFKTWDYLVKGW